MPKDLKNFYVININTQQDKELIAPEAKKQLFNINTSHRNLLVVDEAQHDRLPEALLNNSTVLAGKDAYKHLIEVTCGLLSSKKGEYLILNQVKTAWTDYRNTQKERPQGLDKLVDSSLNLAKFIRTSFIDPVIRETSPQLSAKALATVKKGDTALIIGGSAEDISWLSLALGKDNSTRAGKIILTHAEPDKLNSAFANLTQMKDHKTIISDIRKVPFSDATPDLIASVNQVFVFAPLGKNGMEVDKKILQGWHQKDIGERDHIVLMNHEPKAYHVNGPEWLKLPNIVLPSQIDEHHERVKAANETAFATAAKACDVASSAREKGIKTGKGLEKLLQEHLNKPDSVINEEMERLTKLHNKFNTDRDGWSRDKKA